MISGRRRDHDRAVGPRQLVGLRRDTAPAAMTVGRSTCHRHAHLAVGPSPTKLSGSTCERCWGLRSIVKKIFLMFDNFRARIHHLQLEISWRDPPREGNHDVKGLDRRIGAGAPARLLRPGARRQRSCHQADRERPNGTRRAYPPKALSTASTVEPLDRPLSTPARGDAAHAHAHHG
jgi:hypothetical protein